MYLAFLVRSILTSKIRWHFIHLWPGGTLSFSLRNLKAVLILAISFCIASYQKVVFVSWSIFRASHTVVGTWTPNLWVCLAYHAWVAWMKRFLWFRVGFIHQRKASSSWRLLSMAYCANCTGNDLFVSIKVCHVVLLSFHIIQMFHPLVTCLVGLRGICSSDMFTFSWSTMASNNSSSFPSLLMLS